LAYRVLIGAVAAVLVAIVLGRTHPMNALEITLRAVLIVGDGERTNHDDHIATNYDGSDRAVTL
jgi:hypothetical protein